MRSVWSREAAGSTTGVSPCGAQPGQQDARLDLGRRHRQLVPHAAKGARRGCDTGGRESCSRPATVAPMAARGRSTRAMGRRRMLASPVRTQRKGSEATRPGSRRMSVPELRTSMTSSGSLRPSQPAPWMIRSWPVLLDRHPQRPHRRERRQRVGRAEEAVDPHRTVVDRAQEQRSMRHRLVARARGRCRADPRRRAGSDASAERGWSAPHSPASPDERHRRRVSKSLNERGRGFGDGLARRRTARGRHRRCGSCGEG